MKEFEIKQNTTELSNQALFVSIQNDTDYQKVAEILRSIKVQRKNIVSYWQEAKENSRSAYKAILAKEKEMLYICDKAENLLKEKILEYKKLVEERQIKEKIKAERLKNAEVENLLEQAIVCEENGDKISAEMKIMQAEIVSSLSTQSKSDINKSDGISTQKRWKFRITDNKLVPSFFNDIEIREVNLKRILDLRKQEPAIKIPGIEFYQEEIVTVKQEV